MRKFLFLVFLKKTISDPLLLVCSINKDGTYSLGEIYKEISLTNINVKYNFIINKIKNTEIIEVKNSGNSIIFVYRMILDFYSNNQLIIDFCMNEMDYSMKIKLNLDSSDLECYEAKKINESNFSKKCIVTKSHFN